MVKQVMKHEKFNMSVHGDNQSRYFLAVSDAQTTGPSNYMAVTVASSLSVNDMWFFGKEAAREAFQFWREDLEHKFPDHYFVIMQLEPRSSDRIIHSVFDEPFLIAHRSPPKAVKYDGEVRPEHPETGTW